MPHVTPDERACFLAFCQRARLLVALRSVSIDVDQFRSFVARAGPALLAPLAEELGRLVSFAELAYRWRCEHDLLAIAGFAFAENAYTELLRWALDPATHPASALARQAALLSFFHASEPEAVTPCTQLVTADGIPDLVLAWPNRVVVIEAKTGSMEHLAPSGRWQTAAYGPAVRAELGLGPNVIVHIGYLTPDGHGAGSPDAVAITFVSLVERLARSLDPATLPAGTAFAFGMLFTHMLAHATPPGLDIGPALAALRGQGPDVAVQHLTTLLRLGTLLRPRVTT